MYKRQIQLRSTDFKTIGISSVMGHILNGFENSGLDISIQLRSTDFKTIGISSVMGHILDSFENSGLDFQFSSDRLISKQYEFLQ